MIWAWVFRDHREVRIAINTPARQIAQKTE